MSGIPWSARAARAGAGRLRGGLPVRVRAPRLPAGRRVRARGRARAPRGRRGAAPRVRARRLGRHRGVHVLRAPREAAADRQGGPARAAQPRRARDRRGAWRARRARCWPATSATRTSTSPTTTARRTVRAMFEEQAAWAAEAGADLLIGETFSWLEEALIALEAMRATGLPTVVTLTVHHEPDLREGHTPADACRALEAAGADVVGLNCSRGPDTMLPLLEPIRAAVGCHVAALPVPYRTTDEHRSMQSLRDPRGGDVRPFPTGLDPFTCTRYELGDFARDGARARRRLPRRLLRRGPAPHPRGGRGARAHAGGEPLLARHVQARLLGHRREPQGAEPELRRTAVRRRARRRRAPPTARRTRRRRRRPARSRRGPSRKRGPDTLSAATTRPRKSRTGAATATRSTSDSSSTTA